MKKFILALLVVSTFVSCGKNNQVGSTAVNPNTVATSPVTTINSNSAFQSLAQAIVNNSFVSYANYYTEYKFGTVTNTCVTKDGWFGIDYQSCSTNTSDTTTLIHGQINIDMKKAELNAILSKTVVFQQYSATLFVLRTSDNHTYNIRTDVPMQANPVYDLNNADGKAKQLLSIR